MGLLDSVVVLTAYFSRSKILINYVAYRLVWITFSTSAKVCGLRWLVSPPEGSYGGSGLTGSWVSLPGLGAVLGLLLPYIWCGRCPYLADLLPLN